MDLPIDSMVDLSIVMLVYQRVSNMNMDYQWKITIII